MKYFFSYLFFVLVLISCGPKFYDKNDFTFYDKNFTLNQNSLLRTDGFYVLGNSWSKRNNDSIKPEKYEVYKLYKTGQSNLILVDSLKASQEYLDLMKEQIKKYGKGKNEYTLSQGYYKLQGNKIVIQSVTTEIRQFNYLYGYLENDKLIIVSGTIDGRGKFKDKYFTDYYKRIYNFVPYEKADELEPNW